MMRARPGCGQALGQKKEAAVTNQFELHVTEFDIKTKATFLTDSNGNVDRLSVILLFEPGAKEIVFVRIENRTE